MKSPSKFDSVYSSLNPLQKHAVDKIDGPVMVLAGPGTGKTHVLSARIANILRKTDTPASSILALTFTESAASMMKSRIVSLIGKEGYYVNIQTFHSFCSQVIQNYPEYFPIPRGSMPVTELDRFMIFEEVLSHKEYEALKPLNTPQFYIKDIAFVISQLKREGYNVEEFNHIVESYFSALDVPSSKSAQYEFEKNKKKNIELGQIFREYETRLRKDHLFDFEDMINLVAHAFRNHEDLLLTYQEKLLYLLVDEYQDTNSAQNTVVDLLASYWGDRANLFVVGDPHQSIFRFQGASLSNVLSFVEKYPQAEIITLDKGYRSPQSIYDSAHAVILQNPPISSTTSQNLIEGLSTKLIGREESEKSITVNQLPSQLAEALYVAENIKLLHKEGVEYKDISVLYRNNVDGVEIREALEKLGIPIQQHGGQNILKDETIKQLLQLLVVIYQLREGKDAEMLFEVCSYPWSPLDSILVMKGIAAAGKRRMFLDVFLEKTLDDGDSEDDGLSRNEMLVLSDYVDRLKKWGQLEYSKTFPVWLESVVCESGFFDYMLAHENKISLINALQALYSLVKECAQKNHTFSLKDFLVILDAMQQYNLGIESQDVLPQDEAVTLSTVHKAKGNEWDYVYLIQCVDGKWGNSRSRDLIKLPSGLLPHAQISKKDQNEDDRRLFYVAITRAARHLTITYPDTYIVQGYTRETVPSLFLDEIPDALKSVDTSVPVFLKTIDKSLEEFLRPQSTHIYSVDEKKYLSYLVKDYPLSITALNTYLNDPQHFFLYQLLRVPRAKQEHMSFGTAIHRSLELLFSYNLKRKRFPPVELIENAFEKALGQEILHVDSLERRLAHGKKILREYLREYSHTSFESVYFEKNFGSGMSKTYLGDIHLKGKIDRIDWYDKQKKLVTVIDYKTGVPKSRNSIEGTIKSAGLSPREQTLPEGIRGPYKRQLVFYKLLTELDPQFTPKVFNGVLDFVEPDKKTGKFTQHSFEIDDKEVEDLKNLIKEVMKEIRNLEFLEVI